MSEQNQNETNTETSEDREKRIRAEVDKLTEGKTTGELVQMVTTAGLYAQAEREGLWLDAVRTGARTAPTTDLGMLSLPSSIQDEKPVDPVLQRLTEFRDELNDLLPPPNSVTGPEGRVIGKFRQAVGNVIHWYGQWEKNRDYSSAINASMALGKLSTAAEVLQYYKSEGSNTTYDAINDTITDICSECWDRIGAAAGRIVPFEN